MRRRLRQQLPSQEVPVRKRLRMIAVATLLAAVVSVTIASSSSPSTSGSDAVAAQVTQPTITPIQQLSLGLGEEPFSPGGQEASTESVARVGDEVGQVPGFCRLHS
jgi:hypothetical protein